MVSVLAMAVEQWVSCFLIAQDLNLRYEKLRHDQAFLVRFSAEI